MYKSLTVMVVVPAYNEELLVGRTIEACPEFVDKIIVVDDCSSDNTSAVLNEYKSKYKKLHVIKHSNNQGVGASIASGYIEAEKLDADVAVVMAGDNQMDPDDLPALLDPIIDEEYDYVKGNRLFTGDAWRVIPRVRYFGNAILSLFTKVASGYWHVADSQCGYTAIGKKALHTIDWRKMYARYGQPNDLLVKLNIYDFKVKDVPVKPVYNIGEKSGLKPIRMIPHFWWLLSKLFFYRMWEKYIKRDFHPLVFFYMSAFILLPLGAMFGFYLLYLRLFIGPVEETSALFAAFMIITGVQFLFFGMWMDMDYNKHLK